MMNAASAFQAANIILIRKRNEVRVLPVRITNQSVKIPGGTANTPPPGRILTLALVCLL